jgi:hypothetical protein
VGLGELMDLGFFCHPYLVVRLVNFFMLDVDLKCFKREKIK